MGKDELEGLVKLLREHTRREGFTFTESFFYNMAPKILSWCLKQLPEKKEETDYDDGKIDVHGLETGSEAYGWNACLAEIKRRMG